MLRKSSASWNRLLARAILVTGLRQHSYTQSLYHSQKRVALLRMVRVLAMPSYGNIAMCLGKTDFGNSAWTPFWGILTTWVM